MCLKCRDRGSAPLRPVYAARHTVPPPSPLRQLLGLSVREVSHLGPALRVSPTSPLEVNDAGGGGQAPGKALLPVSAFSTQSCI